MRSGKRSIGGDGRRLRELRLSLGLTQEEVAHHAGLSDRFIRKLERGGPISRAALRAVLEAYQRLAPADLQLSSSHFIVTGQPDVMEDLAEGWLRLALLDWDPPHAEQVLHPAVKLATDANRYRGHSAIRQRYHDLRRAIGPLHPRIDHLLVQGHRLAIYWTAKRHVSGSGRNQDSEDRPRSFAGSWLLTLEDVQIRSIREHSNLHRLLNRSARHP